MDHEWFTEQLGAGSGGWDWFSVQLDNRTELMLFELRRKDGYRDPYSSGTFIDRSGKAHHLKRADSDLRPLAKWGLYPVEWRLSVPAEHIDIGCKPVLRNQELTGSTRYWEGAVDYSGTHTGVGYMELTGYAAPVGLTQK